MPKTEAYLMQVIIALEVMVKLYTRVGCTTAALAILTDMFTIRAEIERIRKERQ